MAKPTNEMEKLGILAAIPGIELAIAALQEQLKQMKEDAGTSLAAATTANHHYVAPVKHTMAPAKVAKAVTGKRTQDGRAPDWREKLSETIKARWAAMTPRERAAKSRALAAARAKKQALKKQAAK